MGVVKVWILWESFKLAKKMRFCPSSARKVLPLSFRRPLGEGEGRPLLIIKKTRECLS